MARTDNLTNFLTDVATAIKNKKGDTTAIKASEFDTEITNLPSGGEREVGFIPEEYDSEGYVTKVRVVGMTSLPDGAFANYSSTVGNFLGKNLKEVILPKDYSNNDTTIPNTTAPSVGIGSTITDTSLEPVRVQVINDNFDDLLRRIVFSL